MHRLNCWMCTLLAAFFCFSFLPRATFAQALVEIVDFAKQTEQERIVALEQKNVQLKAEAAKLNARIDAIDTEIAKLVVQASVTANELIRASEDNVVDRSNLSEEETMQQVAKDLAELAKAVNLVGMQLRLEILSGERAYLEANIATRKAQIITDDTLGGPRRKSAPPRQSSAPTQAPDEMRIMPVPPGIEEPVRSEVALVSVATFTIATPAEGWYAWKRQSQAWKKAHPWEGPNGVWCTNSAHAGIPCTEAAWKKVPVGTIFLLPAPDIRVYVPKGVEAPAIIALVPTDNPQLFKLDPSRVAPPINFEKIATEVVKGAPLNMRNDVSRTNMIVVLAIIFGFLALLFFIFLQIALERIRSKDDLIARMQSRLSGMHTITKQSDEDGCCKTKTSSSTENNLDASPKGGC